MKNALIYKDRLKNNTFKIAVHLHLYYINQLDDILLRLQNLSAYPYDLYVTLVEDNVEAKRKIRQFKADAKIWLVPNLGYDVGPFIDFLHKIDFDEYDYLMKIHTKRAIDDKYCLFNGHRSNIQTCREILLDTVISASAVANNIRLLMQNDKIGMIGSHYLLTDKPQTYRDIRTAAETEMQHIGLNMPTDLHFVAGTMFWVRAKLLKPFLCYQITDFQPATADVHDATLAHILERLFGWAVTTQGYLVHGVRYKSFIIDFMKARIKRFLYQKKITREGRLNIKICKIPVYCGKEKAL